MIHIPAFVTRYKVTQSWQQHIANGSAGGIDWGTPVGTPLIAPEAGTVVYRLGKVGAGNTATVTYANGCATVYQHVSAFVGASGRAVAAGEVVALSGGLRGAPGAGASTGPHTHAHDLDPAGNRAKPFTLVPVTRKRKRMDAYALVKSSTNDTVWMTRASDGAFRPLKGAEGLAFMNSGMPVAVVDPKVLSASVDTAPPWTADVTLSLTGTAKHA